MSHAPQTRQSLLLELAKHSDDAWAEFLTVYETGIFRFCRAMGLQEADARDATQEVLAAVHRKVSTWERDADLGSFRAWLFRVARNVSIDAIADRARRTAAHGGSQVDRVLAELPAGSDAAESAFEAETRRSLYEWAAEQARSEVRDATWRAFHATAVQGRKAEDVAAELGLTVGSVYTAKCRVVARIRERIEQVTGEFRSNQVNPACPDPS